MPQTSRTDQQPCAILQSIAQRAMLERGLLPDFSAAVLAERTQRFVFRRCASVEETGMLGAPWPRLLGS
jgi:hypothetical protein